MRTTLEEEEEEEEEVEEEEEEGKEEDEKEYLNDGSLARLDCDELGLRKTEGGSMTRERGEDGLEGGMATAITAAAMRGRRS